MSSPTVAPLKESVKFSLETVAKSITYSLPMVYVCGFVVLSLFEADYGIVDLSVVRVKALATGILFVFFIAYPAVVSIRSFQVLGLKKPFAVFVEIGPRTSLKTCLRHQSFAALHPVRCGFAGPDIFIRT